MSGSLNELTDPGADRIVFWDDSLSDLGFLTAGSGLIISGTTLSVTGLTIGTDVQAWDADLDTLAALAKTDNNFIVGNGTAWVAESGATARTSLGLGTGDTATFTAVLTSAVGSAFGGASASASTVFNLPAGTTAASSFRVAPGAAPTSPVQGDVWSTSGSIFARLNGVSVDLAASAGFTLGTPQASTSGTAITFTGIPAGTKHILVSWDGISTDGTSALLVQIGDAGGIEPSNYVSATFDASGTTGQTAGFSITRATAAAALQRGALSLTLENAATFTWSAFGVSHDSTPTGHAHSGTKSLSAELTQVSVTSAAGDTFDAGEINIAYS